MKQIAPLIELSLFSAIDEFALFFQIGSLK